MLCISVFKNIYFNLMHLPELPCKCTHSTSTSCLCSKMSTNAFFLLIHAFVKIQAKNIFYLSKPVSPSPLFAVFGCLQICAHINHSNISYTNALVYAYEKELLQFCYSILHHCLICSHKCTAILQIELQHGTIVK